jgi:hypothetical protein
LLDSLFFRASWGWLGLCLLAFLNGALREIIFIKYFGINKLLAHQISCFTGIIFWSLFTKAIWSRLNIYSLKEAIFVGLGWFITTILFETFIIDRKLSWTQIIKTYDISSGQYWGLVVIWILILPISLFLILN